MLQHAGCEPPGVYEQVLRERGVPLRRVLLDEQPVPSDWRPAAALLVMGGAMGAYEEDRYPWLLAERRLIAAAVAAGLPYWGVCLGAQLLAASLGARVRRGPAPELGVMSVSLTAAGAEDPVFAAAPSTFATLQWHGDTYELPAGAVQLARSAMYEQQAFRIGRAYAVQFHLEADTALARRWMEVPDYVEEVVRIAGAQAPRRLVQEVDRAQGESVPLARELFGRWLRDVAQLPAS